MNNLSDFFLLDPDVIFLNHGSFGATPKPVFDSYQNWQLRLERQPVLFLGREYDGLLKQSRVVLAEYLRCHVDDLVFIPNATHGVNILAHSLKLQVGDEVLTTDHEYGACDYTWNYYCDSIGAKYIHRSLHLPLSTDDDIVEDLLAGVTNKTKVIFLSHITSPTAIILPIEKICRRAREIGIITVVDGAHAMGQIPLDLTRLGADFYTSNCHKWALAPKGSAFLYAKPEVQNLVEPLIVSWGYGNDPSIGTGSRFVDLLQWTGTKDPSADLAVPDAIKFMEDHAWDGVRENCNILLKDALNRITEMTGLPPIYSANSHFFAQMGAVPIPKPIDVLSLKNKMYEQYKIEVPFTQLGDQKYLRISIQGYNSIEDITALIISLENLLPKTA